MDPGFEMADETEVPRLIEESLDQSLRIFTGLARKEPDIALVLAQLGLRGRAKGSRRCWIGGSSRGARSIGFSRAGPADLTSDRRLPAGT